MITYNTINVEMPSIVEAEVSAWVKSTANTYNKVVGDINYIFVDDETMLDINRRFIGHDYYTDVITFDYSTASTLNGDIFISLDTVQSNAATEQVSFEEELLRIIIHGVLHLTGQGDKTPESKAQMTEKENLALTKLKTL